MASVEACLEPIHLQDRIGELLTHAAWSRDELMCHQQELLQATLQHAINHSPWHSKRIGRLVAEKRPLSDFPVMTKADLMEHFDEIVTDPVATLVSVEQHLSGDQSGERFLGRYCAFATGGTSGVRAILLHDETAWCNVVANMIRFLMQAGLKDHGRVIGIGANSPLHLSGRAYAELRRWRPGAPHLDVTMPLPAIVSALNEYRPDAIITYPSFIRILAMEQKAGRLTIAPVLFGAVAESLSDDIRALTKDVWGIEILNRYNATEIGSAACECAKPNGIHLPEDLVIFESVDDDNRPMPDGLPGRKLLITTLTNRVQPLIRYELTDLLAITSAPCACGQPFARITSITGRREELLSLPGRDGKIKDVPAIYLAAPLVKVPFVKQFQIVLRDRGLEARIVVSDLQAREEAKTRALKEIGEVLAHRGVECPLTISMVDEIPRQGTGAKIKLVIRE